MASGRKKTQRSATVRVSLGSLIFSLLIYWGNSWNSWPELSQKLQTSELPQIYTFEVVNEYPHDRKAFTQGLLYAGNGTLYESTGLYGRSSVRRVALQTGKVEAQHNMSSSLFGEGLTLLDERLYQVTWKERFGFIYVKHNLSQLSKFNHQMTDGWGLATDGKIFFGSDGTSTLYQMDPQTMKVIKKHIIRYGGVEVIYLNELEYVNGEVWANVWQTDCIARISPADGTLIGWILLSSLREGLIADGEEDIDVLNGIAWDAQGDRIFVTGKLWPKLYEIRVHARNEQPHENVAQLCIPSLANF
uniref:Glutaminyl-peptide cyclotransferase n=1 Tax=Opuntia streptacantha TaxID=393608 RepID=A0A7C9CNZ2_OPUST